jgi:hypothetical protein
MWMSRASSSRSSVVSRSTPTLSSWAIPTQPCSSRGHSWAFKVLTLSPKD